MSDERMDTAETPHRERVRQVAALFLRLGIVGFGGPAAHIAMMEDEVVEKRGWLSRDDFLDIVGATNLIPGPNSTETAIHIGYRYAGRMGLLAAGACFVAPAVALVLLFAVLYEQYGQVPQAGPILGGIQAVVLAIILNAVWKLGRRAVKNRLLGGLGVVVAAAVLLGVNEIVALFAGGLLGMIALRQTAAPLMLLPVWSMEDEVAPAVNRLVQTIQESAVALWQLGGFFLLIGSILYGSGYVLVAFLEGWLVQDFGWLTQQQLLDAIAIGQLTPGPVLSTAAFIGYLLHGWRGGLLSAAAIFAPSFLFVLILSPQIPKMRRSAWLGAFLDAVNVSAVGLIAAVLVQLSVQTLTTWTAGLLAAGAAVLLLRFKISTPLLVVLGAAGGWLLSLV